MPTFMACIEALSPTPSASTRMQISRASTILSTSARASDSAWARASAGRAWTSSSVCRQAREASPYCRSQSFCASCWASRRCCRAMRALSSGESAAGSSRPGSVAGSGGASAVSSASTATAVAPPEAPSASFAAALAGRFAAAVSAPPSSRERSLSCGLQRTRAQAERADRRHLRRGRDAKAAQRERMRHPADVEMDEHPDAQRLDVDLGGDGAGGGLHEVVAPPCDGRRG